MDTTKTKDKIKPIDSGDDVFKHALGFSDRLVFEPVEHSGQLGVLKRDPRQDGILQLDHRALGLPWCAPLGAKVIQGNTGFFEFEREELFADLGVVKVEPVLAGVHGAHLLAEGDHVGGVLVEHLGLRHIVRVVLLEHFDLLGVKHGAHGERQVLDAVGAHVELQHLETGGPSLVVEVVNLEQVDLLDQPVCWFDLVHPAALVTILCGDDCHCFVVQGLGIAVAHLHQRMHDGVVEPQVVVPDHSGFRIREIA